MKEYINQIIGKTIKEVVMRDNEFNPRSQLFLLFSDGSYYELYCHNSQIEGASSIGQNLNIENSDNKGTDPKQQTISLRDCSTKGIGGGFEISSTRCDELSGTSGHCPSAQGSRRQRSG